MRCTAGRDGGTELEQEVRPQERAPRTSMDRHSACRRRSPRCGTTRCAQDARGPREENLSRDVVPRQRRGCFFGCARREGVVHRTGLPAPHEAGRRLAAPSQSIDDKTTAKEQHGSNMLLASERRKMDKTAQGWIQRGDDRTTTPMKVFRGARREMRGRAEAGADPCRSSVVLNTILVDARLTMA